MKLPFVAAIALLLSTFSSAAAVQSITVGGDRPVTVNLPSSLKTPAPLLILLHSASTSGAHQERYMKLAAVAKSRGLIYAAPDGTMDKDGNRFWNAAKSCCDKYGSNVDDISYIKSLIMEISEKVPVDTNRIYLIGHSNGAFMSFTFACKTNLIAAIVAIAGAMDSDFTCTPSSPVSLLNIHGSADTTIKIGGGTLNEHTYTSAATTMSRIAELNQCNSFTKGKKDFEPTIKADETTVFTYSCSTGSQVQFWRIKNGSHSPALPKDFAEQVITFLDQIPIQRSSLPSLLEPSAKKPMPQPGMTFE